MPERVLELVGKAAPYLARNGSTSPRLDAELLLAEALGCKRMDLYLQFERPLIDAELTRFRELCRRRAGGEPIAYIRGRKEFFSIELEVSPDVLVPRPETEILVEEALRLLRARAEAEGRAGDAAEDREAPAEPAAGEAGSHPDARREPPWRLLDIGTGSGAIALALLHELPAATVVATDVSAAALAVARRNAGRLGLSGRVELREGDLDAGAAGPFDLVAANLPYIDPGWADAVTPEVAATEPGLALFAGRDGMDEIGRLLPRLPGLLAPGGAALLEFDPRMLAPLLAAAAEAAPRARVIKDLAGLDRVLVLET
ncbi:MAG TPA: peptide chain release factor N(5)-glutamine methyltransferase [Candidatus Dormibacteraeota bacterium]|jgi:release factor glutamine methyltransferase|nr:peptide chain release factor N(5)-glutamine methyltransferase [Candidatus Dormibacteraeota bacterium]